MNEKQRTLKVLSLSFNVVIAVLEIVGIILTSQLFISYGLHPFGYLQYYTQLSNIFSFFTSSAVAFFALKSLIKGEDLLPDTVKLLKFSSTCCLAETFLVTACVLSPMGMMGGFVPLMFHSGNLYHHFLCPVLSIISLLFFDGGGKLTLKHTFYAFIPTVLYGGVAVFLNLIKVWHGPYPFLYVYEQPVYMSLIWAVLIPGCAYALTLGLRTIANLSHKKAFE